ncbi:adenylate cyclase [Acrasis kona]|uniref:Adenylate cyclase n=1 Tax=Acrasis kona TaxID=1008807 RepID=A0AAW2Z535_9EUKA
MLSNFSEAAAVDFRDQNMAPQSVFAIGVNYFGFYHIDGTLATGTAVDLENKTEIPYSLDILNLPSPLMIGYGDTSTRNGGYMMIDSNICAVITQQVEPSQQDGSVAGWMLMAVRITPRIIQTFADKGQFCVSIHSMNETTDPVVSKYGALVKSRSSSNITLTSPSWTIGGSFAIATVTEPGKDRKCWGSDGNAMDGDRIGSYGSIDDVNQQPIFIVSTDLPRDINNLSTFSILMAFGMVGIVVVLSSVGIIIFIERGVLSPVLRLIKNVREITYRNDPSMRVEVKSKDELGVMSNNINQMLANIEVAQMSLQREQERSEELLHSMLPSAISRKLKGIQSSDVQDFFIADSFSEASIVFSDIVKFTDWSSTLKPTQLVWYLNVIFSAFDEVCERNQVEKIKTIGDAFMCVSGVPEYSPYHAIRAVNQALDMIDALLTINEYYDLDLKIRLGVNTGPVVAGIIGSKKFLYDLWGDAVNVSSRMESNGIPNKIHISSSTYELVKHVEEFEIYDRGVMEIKGKGSMRTYIIQPRKERGFTPKGGFKSYCEL